MLPGYQKVFLRGLGHELAPSVHIGKVGVTPALEAQVRQELLVAELIKVRFHQHKEERRDLALALATAVGGELVGAIGNVVLIYREHPDPEKRKIALPRRPGAAAP